MADDLSLLVGNDRIFDQHALFPDLVRRIRPIRGRLAEAAEVQAIGDGENTQLDQQRTEVIPLGKGRALDARRRRGQTDFRLGLVTGFWSPPAALRKYLFLLRFRRWPMQTHDPSTP